MCALVFFTIVVYVVQNGCAIVTTIDATVVGVLSRALLNDSNFSTMYLLEGISLEAIMSNIVLG